MRAVAQFAYGPTALNQVGFFDGYQVTDNGFFTPLAGSPFPGGPYISMIANSKEHLLYVYGANYINTFKIAPNGQPAEVSKPVQFVPPLAPGGQYVSASLALVSGNGKYVYTLNISTDDEGFAVQTQISVLRVQTDGSLTYNPKDIYNFGSAYSIVGNPAGTLIFGVYPGSPLVGATVAADGSLNPISMPQFPNTTPDAIGLDLKGKYFYVFTGYSPPQQLAVFRVGANGTLTQIAGSPFSDPQGRFDVFTALTADPNGKFFYALGYLLTNSATVGVYAFEEQTDGRLVPVTGSPFSLGAGKFAGNLVMDPRGRFLTVNDVGVGTIPENWVFDIQSNGALKARANSPSSTIPPIESFVGK
jgi:6-phosphogluconolactonase (cycloisomerase 2 family)